MSTTKIDFTVPDRIKYSDTLNKFDELLKEWLDHVETDCGQGYNFSLDRLPYLFYKEIPHSGVTHDKFACLALIYLFTEAHRHEGTTVERLLNFAGVDKSLTLKQKLAFLQLTD